MVEWVIFCFYTADIIVQFLTSYVNVQTGDPIYKFSYIAKRYVSGLEFWIDFLSTFPFSNFAKH